MTAVANPPSFANLNRPGWTDGGQSLNSMNPDDNRMNMFMSRKSLQRSNSSSSISSTASSSSTSTVTSTGSVSTAPTNGSPSSTTSSGNGNGNPMSVGGDTAPWSNSQALRKKAQPKNNTNTNSWTNARPEGASDFSRSATGRPPMANGVNGAPPTMHHQQQQPSSQPQPQQQPQSALSAPNQMMSQNNISRPGADQMAPQRLPVLSLLSLNGTFERKTISVPFYPDIMKIGRQTNAKTVPLPTNGFFDSKVLSRQHAEIWANQDGKIYIKDVKSSNGTFVNGNRLSPENRESEPHELQSQDHLELGIDIVSEDQKTVVHHKVAAKVEHAGFVTQTNNLLDMNFGDLDPSNGGMMMPMGGMPPFRGRAGSAASLASNGRMMPGNMGGPIPGLAQQRQFWLNPVTTEHIVKKLQTEMRNAKLQHHDLIRTGQFITALVTKDDIKNQEKPDGIEPPKPHVNGNVPFKSDNSKTRFSEPPAPPPSQPVPEVPSVARASDAPSLKRGITERPKSHPFPKDANVNQVMQLTEALNMAKNELDSNSARVRDLERMLNEEREARLQAEILMQKMAVSQQAVTNGTSVAALTNGHSELEKAFEPPTEQSQANNSSALGGVEPKKSSKPETSNIEAMAAAFQARIESMTTEMKGLREQLEAFRNRAEQAEAERDADRKTLSQLILQIRQRDEKEQQAAARKSRSSSRGRSRQGKQEKEAEQALPKANGAAVTGPTQSDGSSEDQAEEVPSLALTDTLKPSSSSALVYPHQDRALIQAMPYVSVLGVVLIGMGMMAYLNGWQPQAKN
ncbi:PRO45 [Sordaria macrospora]|uniref:PRO45 n=1 Tax=Sordaria macrospora TaxID=5147 RepID=A0A8S8ZNA2_SORMA|nr:PRO45 [Sordaria macrospora]KAH7634300.1 hypothetical protein B0T09DRAFT_2538 [Sordaria sp. MPI-SDFR-AT-0083]WPJ58899.1 hypothetical protein SMAC4_01224 [Sordaria macrospora]